MKAKRFKFGIALAAIPLFFTALLFFALSAPLPTEKSPIKLYSNQTRDDLRIVTIKALESAKKSIVLHTYALTDPSIKKVLTKKAQQGISVTVYYDPRTTKKLPKELVAIPLKNKGLMHEKIIVIDETLVILGSANMTPTSLQMHDNILLAMHSPKLAYSLLTKAPYEGLYRLPTKNALSALIERLDNATHRIDVAMFTFTHPELSNALIRAHKRGVKVRVTLDSQIARGASKKVCKALREANIPLRLNTGMQLFHYKWAYIDNKTLILGSANWTKAAFTKNHDYFFMLDNPSPTFMKRLKKKIVHKSRKIE